jgi:hypothetical protein
MITERRITTSKFLEAVTGVIFFGIGLATRLAPLAFRDESGEAYILAAFLLIIGGWALFDGLFH